MTVESFSGAAVEQLAERKSPTSYSRRGIEIAGAVLGSSKGKKAINYVNIVCISGFWAGVNVHEVCGPLIES